MKYILASGSPRRRELMKYIVQDFEVQVSGVDEALIDGLTPAEQVTRLAYIKAKDIFDRTSGDRVVIGSDTVVTRNGKIYGKPKDNDNAKSMIKEFLDGDRIHSIMTGLCVLIEKDGNYKEYKTYDEVKVFLKEISDEDIDRWIGTGKALDKAGAYAIQDEFGVHIEKIEGNYYTIVGLPIHKLYDIVKPYLFD